MKTGLCLLMFFVVMPVFSLTKEEVYKELSKKHSMPVVAFKAEIISKMSINNQTFADSGEMYFTPPDCFKITMIKSKTTVSVIGDTVWMAMPDGSVTRKTGKNAMVGMGQSQNYSVPDIGEMLQESGFTIMEQVPEKHVVIEFLLKLEGKEQKVRATIDTKKWLVRKMTLPGGPLGSIETGYEYSEFEGVSVLSSISTVIGSAGFIWINYNKIRKTSVQPMSSSRQFWERCRHYGIWMPDGSVTRKIGKNAVVGMGQGQNFSVPDIGDMLQESSFTIMEQVPEKHIVIEFLLKLEVKEQKVRATINTKNWLVRKMTFPGDRLVPLCRFRWS